MTLEQRRKEFGLMMQLDAAENKREKKPSIKHKVLKNVQSN